MLKMEQTQKNAKEFTQNGQRQADVWNFRSFHFRLPQSLLLICLYILSVERRVPGKKKPWTTAYIKGFVTFLIETMWWKFKTIAPLKIIIPKNINC